MRARQWPGITAAALLGMRRRFGSCFYFFPPSVLKVFAKGSVFAPMLTGTRRVGDARLTLGSSSNATSNCPGRSGINRPPKLWYFSSIALRWLAQAAVTRSEPQNPRTQVARWPGDQGWRGGVVPGFWVNG